MKCRFCKTGELKLDVHQHPKTARDKSRGILVCVNCGFKERFV